MDIYVDKDNQLEVYEGIYAGECEIGLVDIDSYKSAIYKKESNPNCDLEWVGRQVTSAKASFAVKGSGELCTSIFRDVLDIHLLEMKLDNTLEEIFKSIQSTKTNNCNGEKELNTSDGLSVADVGGAFTFYAILAVTAIIISMLQVRYPQYFQVKKYRQYASDK